MKTAKFGEVKQCTPSTFMRTTTAVRQQVVDVDDGRELVRTSVLYELVPGCSEPVDHYDLIAFGMRLCPFAQRGDSDDVDCEGVAGLRVSSAAGPHRHLAWVRVVQRFTLRPEVTGGELVEGDRVALCMVAAERFAMHVATDVRCELLAGEGVPP